VEYVSKSQTIRPDPLRRFTPTPYTTLLPIMNRTICLETNDERILKHAVGVFSDYQPSVGRLPDFLWRIVSQPCPQMDPVWPKRSAFSESGLRFAEFGQTNFVAVDLDAREGVGYLSEALAKDDLGLTSPYLDNMFCWTAGSLGLTSLFAACVGVEGHALLVAGASGNGKTTASYIAAKNGLEFQGDRAVFLEMRGEELLAWGDFSPAAFRTDTLNFLPELQSSTRPLRYFDFTYHYLDKRVYQTAPARPVIPVCCVFLDRQTAGKLTLSRLSRNELSKRLDGLSAFQDDARFETQREAVFNALAALPAYNLVFANDPAAAAECFPGLLREHMSR
jgi:hypothetical protein